jgi:hypothetical protein
MGATVPAPPILRKPAPALFGRAPVVSEAVRWRFPRQRDATASLLRASHYEGIIKHE